jgi:Predicted metal-sulfur cluster biosynthetic enzyme
VVAEAQVWEALEEIPDPEIPVVSLVDLGVIRSVDVQTDTSGSSSRRPSSAVPRSR